MHPGERNFNRFPGWLGKNSTHNKNRRLLHELHSHMITSGYGGFQANSAALRESYAPLLKVITTRPMKPATMAGGFLRTSIRPTLNRANRVHASV